MSEDLEFNNFENTSALLWKESGLSYDWDEINYVEKLITFKTPELLQNNGSVYAHVYFRPSSGEDYYTPHLHAVNGTHRKELSMLTSQL